MWQKQNLTGYLDPRDNVIDSRQIQTDCEITERFPIEINGHYYEYIKDGLLHNLTKLKSLKMSLFHDIPKLKLRTTPVFGKMLLYDYEELQTGIDSNDIFRTRFFTNCK